MSDFDILRDLIRDAALASVELRGARCLVAYCRAIGREFWQEPNFLEEKKYQQRFVSVKNIWISKKPTRQEPKSGLHNTPKNMLKLNGAANGRLQFNELVGKPKRKSP